MRWAAGFVLGATLVWGCSGPEVALPAPPTAEPLEAPIDEAPEAVPALTGLAALDGPQEFELRIIDARGSGTVGGTPVVPGQPRTVGLGVWMLTEAGSEYELTVRSPQMADGIVRLAGATGLALVRRPGAVLPLWVLRSGQASFYLAELPPGGLVIRTPAGDLTTRGAVFSVTVARDGQVLVTVRDGQVVLRGRQNLIGRPGQVFTADRRGQNRVLVMTPNEASVFADRWRQITDEGVTEAVAQAQKRRWDQEPLTPWWWWQPSDPGAGLLGEGP